MHSIYDPNQVYNDKWQEKTEIINQDPVLFKSYSQNWLKIDSGILISHLYVFYSWKNGKSQFALVSHDVRVSEPAERIQAYAAMHPEEFDPNQLEQIENLRLPPLEDTPNQTDKFDTR
ncbi:MAG: hypothetical protein AMJ79_12925 [Phycisphaerae bacterium SM23_30]|nr:MAG: hypothetical protein AMJ79_12925 [Phycisphaerae bacterium SM23_30]